MLSLVKRYCGCVVVVLGSLIAVGAVVFPRLLRVYLW